MKFKTLFIAFVLCAAASAAQAGCMDLPQQNARRALQILKNQIMVAEYCEKCLSPLNRHRLQRRGFLPDPYQR